MKVFAFLAASASALECLKCNAKSWADCAANGVVQTCQNNEHVCQVHERKRAGKVYRVRMECKQWNACMNNKEQNFFLANKAHQNDQCKPDATGELFFQLTHI